MRDIMNTRHIAIVYRKARKWAFN